MYFQTLNWKYAFRDHNASTKDFSGLSCEHLVLVDLIDFVPLERLCCVVIDESSMYSFSQSRDLRPAVPFMNCLT